MVGTFQVSLDKYKQLCVVIFYAKGLNFEKNGFRGAKKLTFSKVQGKDGTVSIAISKRNEINPSSLKQINRLEITFSTTYHRIIYIKPF